MSMRSSSPPCRLVGDELWALVEPLIPPPRPGRGPGGRPRVPDRSVLEGMSVLAEAVIAGHFDLVRGTAEPRGLFWDTSVASQRAGHHVEHGDRHDSLRCLGSV